MKEIIGTGLLPSLSPSALAVLTYAAAFGDFSTCRVYLGAKTIAGAAFNGSKNRNSARRGIEELLDVGLLAQVQPATNRRAAVYRLALVRERVIAARERMVAVGARRRKSAEGGHVCAPRGVMYVPPGGSWVCPQGGHGCAPNHSKNVPSSLMERMPSGRSSRRSGDQEDEGRIAGAAVKRQGA